MTLNCEAVEGLIDLYAAGETAPEEREAVRAHLAGCSRCQRQLDEARSLQGLLDVHYQSPGGLARLRQAVRREAGPGPRLLRFAKRVAPLAALLLVALGLALLLPHRIAGPASAALPAELTLTPEVVPGPAPSRGKPKRGDKEMSLPIEAEAIQVLKARKALLPVALQVTLRNPGDVPLVVELGGDHFALRLGLRGPRVEREQAPPTTRPPVPGPRPVVLPPGGRHALELTHLAEQIGPDVFALYPATEGVYRLSVEVRARTWPPGAPRQTRERTWKAGPVVLPLKPGATKDR